MSVNCTLETLAVTEEVVLDAVRTSHAKAYDHGLHDDHGLHEDHGLSWQMGGCDCVVVEEVVLVRVVVGRPSSTKGTQV